MEKAYLFLRKLVTLSLNILIFLLLTNIVSPFISIPVLLLVFAFIVSRITSNTPKELYNYNRSEVFFTRGGLRDLVRIPVVLFGFLHDFVVWQVWGLYQILLLVTDIIYFFKQVVFWVLHALIWVGKLLAPFWVIAYKLFIHYVVKWNWWIYRYSFHAIKKSYNWNIIKVSLIGALIALLTYQLFYFLEITLDIFGLRFIGFVLALLPTTWAFGEIASIRGQKLMFAPFWEVKSKMKNGLESVRGLLFFITFFVVVLIAQAGFTTLGWIPKAGGILLGFSINISYIFNIILILLGITIFFSSFVLPSYRLYNEFNETSFKNVYELFVHIIKRSLQYLIGFIPSSFFASLTIIPPTLLVALALFLTMQGKNSITEIKIQKLTTKQSTSTSQLENHRISKEIDRLEDVALFPRQFFQDLNHKDLIKKELDNYKSSQKHLMNIEATKIKNYNNYIKALNDNIETEKNKSVINQTRLEEYTQQLKNTEIESENFKTQIKHELDMTEIDIEYAKRKNSQMSILFYLTGLFTVVVLTLPLAFAISYLGNYFYRAFLFRNNATQAKWKDFIEEQKEKSKAQPLLSTTLNIIIIISILVYMAIQQWITLPLISALVL